MSGRAPVVTGTGLICSVGNNSDAVWTALVQGTPGLGPLTLLRSPRHGSAPVGEIKDDVDRLAGHLRGSRTDKLAWFAARQALIEAGLEARIGNLGPRVGVVMASTVGGVLKTEQFLVKLLHHHRARYGLLRHHECASVTDLCAREFQCFGPTTSISTACSGGAMAIAMAARMIESGDADIMVAGGSDSLCKLTVNGFGSLMLLDPDGCRPFDANRAGISLGEGAGALIIESEASAAARGAPVQARLSGWGYSCDAFHATAPEPEGRGACQAMSGALHCAGLEPQAINHINAHGTGTPGNDLAEAKAIQSLFGDTVPPLLSTKGLIGHTLGASGAIDAVLAIKSLAHGGPPPSAGFTTPDPAIGLVPVQRAGTTPQNHVLSNAFGFGGNNVSLVFSRPSSGAPRDDAPVPSATSTARVLRVTGIGIVAALGHDLKTVFARCTPQGADSNLREITAPLPPARVRVYSCPEDFGAKAELKAGRRRRLERVQQMAVVAAKRSCPESALAKIADERICVAMGTGLGCTEATAKFVEPIIEDEAGVPSPQKFTNAVHNALASQVAIEVTARGLNSTATHRDISFESALWHAVQEIKTNRSDVAFVGGADEITPYLLSAGSRWGWWSEDSLLLKPLSNNLAAPQRAIPGEGAVVFCIDATGGDTAALAEICAVACGRFAMDAAGQIDSKNEATWIESRLAAHNIALSDIDMIISGANGEPVLDARYVAVVQALGRRSGAANIRHGTYKHLCGDYHSASAFGMAMAVGVVSGHVSPKALLATDGACRLVLLYTLSDDGTRAMTCVRHMEAHA